MPDDTWRFIYAADMQPGSPRSFRFNPAWFENWRTARRQIIDLAPELLLIGGDLTRDGGIHPWELRQAKADLDEMGIPYHVIAGNMDTGNKHTDRQGPWPDRDDISLNITSEQVRRFESVFGPSCWSVVHRSVRITGLCDMLLGSNLPEEDRLWPWLERQQAEPRSIHHIWLTHYALFADRPDEPNHDITDPAQYLDWYFTIDQPYRGRLMEIMQNTAATRVITGHIHCRKRFVVDGIHFDLAPAVCGGQWADKWPDGEAAPGFLQYDVCGNTMTKTFVPLEPVSRRTDGYGLSGHPKPECRDYSLAWDKSPADSDGHLE